MEELSNSADIALVLRELFEKDIPGIYPSGGRSLADACSFCLHSHSHARSVRLAIVGSHEYQCLVQWEPEQVTEQLIRFWNDPDRAAEWGAEGIAILLVIAVSEFTVVDRSRKGKGFDYWLGHKDSQDFFSRDGRLEVSGVFRGTDSQLNQRAKKKIEQTKKSDDSKLPAFAVVVEFSRPKAKMIRR